MNYYSSQILLLVHDIIDVSCTHIHTKGGVVIDFAKRWTWSKMISFKVVNNIAIPSYFVSTFIKKKEIVGIISTLQMAQAPNFLKSKVEIILNVSFFNLASRMAIMFHVHSLHLLIMTARTNNGGEFKQNITIKCGWNATNNLNGKLIIVQIFQFGASMGS